MRMKSQNLMGTVELVGEISDLSVKDDWLILKLRTSTPAGWNMKVAMSHEDIISALRMMLKPKNIAYVLFGFGKPSNKKVAPNY